MMKQELDRKIIYNKSDEDKARQKKDGIGLKEKKYTGKDNTGEIKITIKEL